MVMWIGSILIHIMIIMGMDTKYGTGRRIEDITDSMGRKKYYSGPGK
jgi:hypothetical protein